MEFFFFFLNLLIEFGIAMRKVLQIAGICPHFQNLEQLYHSNSNHCHGNAQKNIEITLFEVLMSIFHYKNDIFNYRLTRQTMIAFSLPIF